MSAPITEPRIEPATIEDLPQLVELLVALFSEEADFDPNKAKQEHGLRMILEQPNRGRIFVLRTDHQVAALSAQLQREPAALKAQEIPRMQTVMKNFSIYKVVEMVLLILGLGMLAFWQRNDLAAGIGIGLVLQAALTLTLDLFAETRGTVYLSALQAMPG